MKTQYTKAELRAAVAALQEHFDRVDCVDQATGLRIDIDKWELTDICLIGRVGISGTIGSNLCRTWLANKRFYQGYCRLIHVEEQPCILIMQSDITETMDANEEFYGVMEQFNRSMYRDQSTGMFNRRYLEEQYAAHALLRHTRGTEVSIAVVRVNEYDKVKAAYGQEAAERLLGTAASVLQRQINLETQDGAVARFSEDQFCVSCIGHSKEHFADCLNSIFQQETMTCHVKFGRTIPFTLSMGVVGLKEASNWGEAEELAFQRMVRCQPGSSQVITD